MILIIRMIKPKRITRVKLVDIKYTYGVKVTVADPVSVIVKVNVNVA
jgi:hypothetical protein